MMMLTHRGVGAILDLSDGEAAAAHLWITFRGCRRRMMKPSGFIKQTGVSEMLVGVDLTPSSSFKETYLWLNEILPALSIIALDLRLPLSLNRYRN